MMLFAQDMALALTGSSTCTLIAFVFPALLFVQAAKEAQGKSDETVRVYHMHACMRQQVWNSADSGHRCGLFGTG
jgi:hypothetical protein